MLGARRRGGVGELVFNGLELQFGKCKGLEKDDGDGCPPV